MNSRRELLKRLGLFGAGAGAFAVAPGVTAAVTLHSKSNCETEGPLCTKTFGIQNGTKLKYQKPTNSEYCLFTEQYEEYKQVSMAVGRDGNLWLKTEGDNWKRVVTE